jgi:hypothetical protein
VSLKDRLAKRQRAQATYRLQITDPSDAQAKVQAAERAARRATGDKAKAADKKVKAARRALDACYESIVLTALPADDYEALVEAHPPEAKEVAEAQAKKEPPPVWNTSTFRPALLAECVEDDMTADDWRDALNNMSAGERQELFVEAVRVNEQSRTVDPMVLPKGSTQILSLLQNLK